MTEILAFIAAHMSYLWQGGLFRIVASMVYPSRGEDGYLEVESARIRLRFTLDRGQLFLEFQTIDPNQSNGWYSVDLFRRLLLGQREFSGLLDEGYAAFLEANLPAIDQLFLPENWHETRRQLEELKHIRAQEMFHSH